MFVVMHESMILYNLQRTFSSMMVQLGAAKTVVRQQQAVVPSIQAFKVNESGTIRRSFFSTPRTEGAAPAISHAQVKDLFSLWNDALATLDPDRVAKRYASTTVLLPTVSDTPRTDYNGIKSYFIDFLQKKPQGVVLESNVIQGEDWCMDAGIYEFTMGASVRNHFLFVLPIMPPS